MYDFEIYRYKGKKKLCYKYEKKKKNVLSDNNINDRI